MSVSANRKITLQALEALLREGLQNARQWSGHLSTELQSLREIGVVITAVPPGKRTRHVIVRDTVRLAARIESLRGDEIAAHASVRASNLNRNGDTKNGLRLPYMLLNLLHGSQTTWRNRSGRSLGNEGDDPGAYQGIILRDGSEDDYEPKGPLVLVENRDVWINIRPLLPEALRLATLVQYEGWLSERFTSRLATWQDAEIFLLADFDPVGFHNHLRLQRVRPDAQMMLPVLSDAQLDQWGNNQVWHASAQLRYTLDMWAATSKSKAAHLYQRLAHRGLAVEQEALLGINDLEWHEIERVEHGKCTRSKAALPGDG